MTELGQGLTCEHLETYYVYPLPQSCAWSCKGEL